MGGPWCPSFMSPCSHHPEGLLVGDSSSPCHRGVPMDGSTGMCPSAGSVGLNVASPRWSQSITTTSASPKPKAFEYPQPPPMALDPPPLQDGDQDIGTSAAGPPLTRCPEERGEEQEEVPGALRHRGCSHRGAPRRRERPAPRPRVPEHRGRGLRAEQHRVVPAAPRARSNGRRAAGAAEAKGEPRTPALKGDI